MALLWSNKMDQIPSQVAATLVNLERGAFWVERIITITLTCLWIHSYFYFFCDSKESLIFSRAAIASAHVLLFTNTLFIVCLFIRTSLDAPVHNQDPQDGDREMMLLVELCVFCFERFGMVLLSILCLPLGLTYVQSLQISIASCILLFPISNILYSEIFIFGCLKEKGDSFGNCSGGTNEIADGDDQDRGHQTEEEDDTSTLMPNVYSSTICAEEARKETQDYGDISGMSGREELGPETQKYDSIWDTSSLEELGIETQEYDDNMEFDGNIPDIEEVEETKEGATEEENGVNNTFSEESFEMLSMQDNKMQGGIQELDQELKIDNENYQKMVSIEMLNSQVHQMRRGIQELEKQLATAKQKDLKRLKKAEDKWERKLKNVAEKYREERRIWEEQKFDLVSRLSATASRAEFHYIQAQDIAENHRKLEEEKNDLIMKLCAANASSEVYRSLLHDDLGSTLLKN